MQQPVPPAKPAEPEKPKVDYATIIKHRSYVIHKKFGKGFVTQLNVTKGYVWVRFWEGEAKGEKKFDFPAAFENGFLSPMQENVTAEKTSDPKKTVFKDKKLRCVDCGRKFVFSAEEQKYFYKNGWKNPIRCKFCRESMGLEKHGSF